MARLSARWIRLGVSAGAFAVLLAIVPLSSVLDALSRLPAQTLVAALLFFMAGHVAAALKWHLLQGRAAGVPLRLLLRAHFAGVVANLWLPSVVGGDLVRAGLALRRSSRPGLVAVASLVDRAIDSVGLILIAAVGAAAVGALPRGAGTLLASASALMLAGGAAAVLGYSLLQSRWDSKLGRQVVEACGFLARRPGRVAICLVMSIAVQATFIGVNITLGSAVGVRASTGAWLMAWPLAKLAALAPISAAGFGVREAALVALLRPFGDSVESILAAGLLWQAVFITGGLLGWGLLTLLPAPEAAQGMTGQEASDPLPDSGLNASETAAIGRRS